MTPFFRPKKSEPKVALLVTDDSAVESAVRETATAAAVDEVKHVRDCREALGSVVDGLETEAVAIVDMETSPSGRRLVETASASVPVIAISTKECSWLSSMLRRHRVAAALIKPIDTAKLRAALQRVKNLRHCAARTWI